jgi:hypothetical protein
MADGWLAMFDEVPWAKMRSLAPSLVERAKRVWRKRLDADTSATPQGAPAEPVAAVDVRVLALERKVSGLGEETVASFEVVQAIAEQHSQLVHAVDVLLARTRLLFRISLFLAAALVALAGWLALLSF